MSEDHETSSSASEWARLLNTILRPIILDQVALALEVSALTDLLRQKGVLHEGELAAHAEGYRLEHEARMLGAAISRLLRSLEELDAGPSPSRSPS